MTNVIYNIDIPDGPNNPSQDQPKMKTNTNSLKSLIEFDHIGFGNNQGGYHKTIHQPELGTWTQATRTAAPPLTPVVSVNQIIAMNVTPQASTTSTDTQLFAMTGASNGTTTGVYQLTGNLLGSDGYFWSGGLLIQWGTVTTGVFVSNPVTFLDRVPGAIAFPNTCFGVLITPNFSGAPNKSPTYSTGSITNTGFTWNIVDGQQPEYPSFFWVAIGI